MLGLRSVVEAANPDAIISNTPAATVHGSYRCSLAGGPSVHPSRYSTDIPLHHAIDNVTTNNDRCASRAIHLTAVNVATCAQFI